MNETTTQLPDCLQTYPEEFRPLAHKLLTRMSIALKQEDDRRKHGQICKILNCLSDPNPQPARVLGFWNAEAKELAKEWETLRVATIQARADRAAYLQRLEEEDRARQAAANAPQEAPAPAPNNVPPPNPANDVAAPRYRELKYIPGQNPFRPGTKNSRIWDLLLEGNRTRDQIAEASGADWKSVGYVIFLARQSGLTVTHDKASKTYHLVPPPPAA